MLFDRVASFGRVVTTTLKGTAKAVLANIAGIGEADVNAGETSGEEPIYSALGVFFRPRAQVDKKSATGNNVEGVCEVICLKTEDGLLPIGFRDLRLSAKVNPKEGEIGLVQYAGGFISLKDNATKDGTDISIYAVRNDGAGVPVKASAISIDTSVANSHISLMHESGASVTITKEGKIVLASPDGSASIVIGNGEIVLSGNVQIPGGAIVGNPISAVPVMVGLAPPGAASAIFKASINP